MPYYKSVVRHMAAEGGGTRDWARRCAGATGCGLYIQVAGALETGGWVTDMAIASTDAPCRLMSRPSGFVPSPCRTMADAASKERNDLLKASRSV